MLALMDEVDHPHVRLNFDTGNIAYYNQGVDPCDELEKVKHLVRNVHLKDNRGRLRGLVLPGRRRRRQRRFRARPRRSSTASASRGPYTIEIEGIGGEPEPGLDARQERIAERPAPAGVRLLRLIGWRQAPCPIEAAQ